MELLAGSGSAGRSMNCKSTFMDLLIVPPNVLIPSRLVDGWPYNGALFDQKAGILLQETKALLRCTKN